MKPVLRVPSRQDLEILCSTLGPVSLIYLCKNFTYIQLQVCIYKLQRTPLCWTCACDVHDGVNRATKCPPLCGLQLSATVLEPLRLAAHQLLYSLWSLTSFLTVPLEQVRCTFAHRMVAALRVPVGLFLIRLAC